MMGVPVRATLKPPGEIAWPILMTASARADPPILMRSALPVRAFSRVS